MAHVRKDRVKETSTTTGTGSVALLGALAGFQSFASAIGVGNTCDYAITGPGGAWETGLGTLSGASTLQRTVVYESANGGDHVVLPTGTKEVFVALPASRVSLLAASDLANVSQTDARTKVGTGTMAYRNVTISTADPTGGVDGDIWLKV